MSQHSVNFGEWLRRLGFKTGTEPRFIEAIQPVQVIGDASALTPPFIPNAAWTGGQISGVVAEFPVIQITGSAPGGTIVSAFRVRAHAGLGKFSLEIRTSPQALTAGGTPLAFQNFGPAPVQTTGRTGTNASGYNNALPQPVGRETNASLYFDADVFVPPGFTLEIRHETANIFVSWAAVVEDVIASRAE